MALSQIKWWFVSTTDRRDLLLCRGWGQIEIISKGNSFGFCVRTRWFNSRGGFIACLIFVSLQIVIFDLRDCRFDLSNTFDLMMSVYRFLWSIFLNSVKAHMLPYKYYKYDAYKFFYFNQFQVRTRSKISKNTLVYIVRYTGRLELILFSITKGSY